MGQQMSFDDVFKKWLTAEQVKLIEKFVKSSGEKTDETEAEAQEEAEANEEENEGEIEMSEKKKKSKYENVDVGIKREGTQIILPSDPGEMSLDEAIVAIQRKKAEEEETVRIHEIVRTFPLDGAYAFMKAMKEIYGWANPVPTPGFFGDNPPTTVALEIGPNEYTQVIWGSFIIPGVKGRLETGTSFEQGKRVFAITGMTLKKHQKDIKRLAERTREIVARESVYRGKSIRLTQEDDSDFGMTPPRFMDISRVNPDELTFSTSVMTQINTNLFTPIEKTEACRRYKIPLKRGVLLEGPYGTGKTLTAFVCAQKCEANGWTFILVDQVSGLKPAIEFARMYQPAVVFAEDIDRAVSGERSVSMDDVLNTIDGIESKGSEIITILTSNHVEDINPAMLRPGRLDAVIRVHAPDAKAAEKLVRIYARDTLEEGADLTAAGIALEGRIPAVIRETVERSKLYAISRLSASDSKSRHVMIASDDLVHAATEMKHHLALLVPPAETTSAEQRFAESMREVMTAGLATQVTSIQGTVERIRARIS